MGKNERQAYLRAIRLRYRRGTCPNSGYGVGHEA